MLGLQRGTVRIVAHDPKWKCAYNHEKTALLAILGNLVVDIQHVGSTAVPGLSAKPIIDIALAVRSWEQISEVSEKLAVTDWMDRGWAIELSADRSDGDYLFVKECQPECRTHHLHIVEVNTLQWKNYLDFRDILIKNAQARTEYTKLKNDLANKYADQRESYTSGKKAFISAMLNS